MRDTKVEITATQVEPTDCRTLSFICVHLRSSAAKYAFDKNK
jgi:hypothetical protein